MARVESGQQQNALQGVLSALCQDIQSCLTSMTIIRNRCDQIVLAVVIEIERALTQARFADDVSHGRLMEPVTRKALECCGENLVSPRLALLLTDLWHKLIKNDCSVSIT